MFIKLASWNIGWFGNLLQGRKRDLIATQITSGAGRALQKKQRRQIAREIELIDADILCILEGPAMSGAALLEAFCAHDLNGAYTVIKRPAGDPSFVRGAQGIWFIVRSTLVESLSPSLLPIDRWREATEYESRPSPNQPGDHSKQGTWPIRPPWFKPLVSTKTEVAKLGNAAGDPPVPQLRAREHFHWRHPQVLVCEIKGRRVDFIGLHLKSKFQDVNEYKKAAAVLEKANPTAAEIALVEKVEQKAIESRIKLTTEAIDVRLYVDNRFRNEQNPIIFMLGDLNDGIGKEYFERLYLFHDLLTNLQGDVFFSRRFFNHALFDYGIESDDNFRWTAHFQDAWDPYRPPEILLDHIMFTQSVVGPKFALAPLDVAGKAGKVEHDAHVAANAVFASAEEGTSDHRAVSVMVEVES